MVTMKGNVSRNEVFSSIKGCDLVVMPSRSEGFGIVAIEAMAAGVPIVASRIDALSEVIKDGETGLLFKPGDDSDLAEKIILLIENPNLRKKLGVAGNKHARKFYDVTVQQSLLSQCLEQK